MKEYPSISRQIQGINIYAFDKLDGSNIRAEWNRKTGFAKFGSRTQLIDKTHQFLGKAPQLIFDNYAKELEAIFKKERYERVTCFFEFYGKNSFAGIHKEGDDHKVTLIDVDIFKKGIMKPGDFIKVFGSVVEIPKMVFYGKPNWAFQENIKNSAVEGVTEEGVVCKSNETDKYGHPIMFKVKSDKWLQRLKQHCGNDDRLYKLLE